MAAGELSPAQAGEIASAASADPSAESELVAVAASKPLGELTQRCRAVRAAAADERARHAAQHRARYLRHWTGADRAFRLDLYTTPEAGAAILAGLAPFQAQAFADARAAAVRERSEAYAADALEAMARASGTGPSEAIDEGTDGADGADGADGTDGTDADAGHPVGPDGESS